MATDSRLEKRGNKKICEKCKEKIYKDEDFIRVSLITKTSLRSGNIVGNYHFKCYKEIK